jgi:hydroxymethylpyrimidine/phosphomethylpyrimidine kinase
VTGQIAVALTIAGSDSGAGAGIQADLKTFAAFGVYGVSAITAVTAQNTLGVRAIHLVPAAVVAAQIDAIFDDFDVAAVKIGMLVAPQIVEVVADRLRRLPLRLLSPAGEEAGAEEGGRVAPGPMKAFVVYDPVMTASSGDALSSEGFIDSIRTSILPLVDCLTPNLPEAGALLGEAEAQSEETMVAQGRALIALGPRAVLMKGGHLNGPEAADLLVTRDQMRRFSSARIPSKNLHGTGCVLSAAIAARIALGDPLLEATAIAKTFVARAIEAGREATFGHGRGPLMPVPWRGE